MKRTILMVVVLGFIQVSCITVFDYRHEEQGADPIVDSRPDWSRYIGSLVDKSQVDLEREETDLEKTLLDSDSWEDRLKLAMVVMTRSTQSKKYERVKTLLTQVAHDELASSEAQDFARWFIAINQQSIVLQENLSSQISQNQDLRDKLQALSSIEKKLDERARQDL